MTNQTTPRKSSGFTLIELLVVIAIIALLVSILLPSLNKAKELAKKAVCSSQLKGFGTALNMYANVHDGWLVPARAGGSDGNDHKWSGLLYEYLPIEGKTAGTMPASTGPMFVCPSNPYRYGGKYDLNYLYNSQGLTIYDSENIAQGYHAPKKIEEIKTPSERVAFSDGWLAGEDEGGNIYINSEHWFYISRMYDGYDGYPPIETHWGTIGMLHNNHTANLGWLDAHVTSHTSLEVNDNWKTWIGEQE